MAQHSSSPTIPPPHRASADGYDPRPVDALLAPHGALLARLKLCYGADQAAFERELLPVVGGYAGYVHQLPATADSFFSEPGGLLRLGLETAFYALQGTDAHILSGKASISQRVELEPRWRLATFVGGLCGELHRALGPATAVGSDGAVWPACRGPLVDWLAQHRCSRYRVHWRTAPHDARAAWAVPQARGMALFALPHLLPPELLQYLDDGDSAIVAHLLASIGGVPLAQHNVLDRLVRRSAALVISRDLLVRAAQGGAATSAEHLARYLLDALRRLAATHSAWMPNHAKSRVWYALDGLFLSWPGCAKDLLELLAADELAGMPGDPHTVLDVLLQAGILVPRASDHAIWTIQPPSGAVAQTAVKLSAPALLLAGTPLLEQPLDRPLAVMDAVPGAPRSGGQGPSSHAETAAAARVPAFGPVPPPAAAVPAGTAQLSLLDEAPAPAGPGHPQPEASGAARTEAPSTRVKAPLRLHPDVRSALVEIAAANAASGGAAGLVLEDDGVFIALEQFQRLGVQPALALRALREARLLAGAPGETAGTCTRTHEGRATLGVRIAPEHFEGLLRRASARPADDRAQTVQLDGHPAGEQPC